MGKENVYTVVRVAVICPKCGHVIVVSKDTLKDAGGFIKLDNLTSKIDEKSNNINHDPDNRYIECSYCLSKILIEEED